MSLSSVTIWSDLHQKFCDPENDQRTLGNLPGDKVNSPGTDAVTGKTKQIIHCGISTYPVRVISIICQLEHRIKTSLDTRRLVFQDFALLNKSIFLCVIINREEMKPCLLTHSQHWSRLLSVLVWKPKWTIARYNRITFILLTVREKCKLL